MIVDFLRPKGSDNAVVNRDVGDSEQIGRPILIKRQKHQHDKKVKMKLDIAAREMHQDCRRADQSQTHGGSSKRSVAPAGPTEKSENSDYGAFKKGVEDCAVAKGHAGIDFPTVSGDRAE